MPLIFNVAILTVLIGTVGGVGVGLLFWVEMLNLPVLVDCTSRAAARALVLWFSRFFYFHFFGLFGLILIGSSAPSLSCCDNSVSIPSIVLSLLSLHLRMLSVCIRVYVLCSGVEALYFLV